MWPFDTSSVWRVSWMVPLPCLLCKCLTSSGGKIAPSQEKKGKSVVPEAAAFGCTAEQRPGGTQSTKAWSVLTSVLEIASGRALQCPWPVCPSPALSAAFLGEFLTADDVSYRAPAELHFLRGLITGTSSLHWTDQGALGHLVCFDTSTSPIWTIICSSLREALSWCGSLVMNTSTPLPTATADLFLVCAVQGKSC